MTGTLKGPAALLHLSLVLSVSISSAVVGEIKMLLTKGVLKNSKGDISTFGIEQARSFPVLTSTIIGFIQTDITLMKTRVLRLLKKAVFLLPV